MELNKKVKQKIVEYFKAKPSVAAIYLYGSQARGDAGSASDIDLAVLMKNNHGYSGFDIPQIVFSQGLTDLIGQTVEVQDLGVCSIDFVHRVLTEGILLLSNNEEARVEFEVLSLKKYFDMKPSIDEYFNNLSEISKKGELHVRYI